jgi:hypothetical protein
MKSLEKNESYSFFYPQKISDVSEHRTASTFKAEEFACLVNFLTPKM